MDRRVRDVIVRLIAGLVPLLLCGPAAAQISGVYVPADVTPGSTINLIATWDGRQPLDGFDVELDPEMDLLDVRVLRFGRDLVPLRHSVRESRHRISIDETRRSPHEIILTVELPDATFPLDWRLIPLRRSDDGSLDRSSAEQAGGVVSPVAVRDNPDDQALTFRRSGDAILLRPASIPRISYAAPFELSLWLKSTGLDEIVLSTWDGQEDAPYPLELEVGPAGRLFVFRGNGGMHESMSSRRAIADGSWHKVAVVFDGESTRLMIDDVEEAALSTPYIARTTSERVFALGGRYAEDARTFSGYIDDLTLYAEDAGGGAASSPASRLALSFDEGLATELLARGSAEPVFTTSRRLLTLPPGSLHGRLIANGLQLQWEGSADAGGTFIVERSDDGRRFEDIGSVEADDARPGNSDFDFVDDQPGEGVRYYRVVHELPDGSRLISRSVKVGLAPETRESVELIGNFPNPFTDRTTIAYRLEESQQVELSVWDLSGQRLATLVQEVVSAGRHEVPFQAGSLPSGTYFLRLQTPNRSVSQKMILTK